MVLGAIASILTVSNEGRHALSASNEEEKL